jgi:hypothetical protein
LENKLKLNEIAKAYGVSRSAIEKWNQTKRQQAIRLLSAGVNPQIMELVGEVQRLCYAASMVLGETVVFSYYYDKQLGGHFNVHYFKEDEGQDEVRIDIAPHVKMTPCNLRIVVTKLDSIING